MKEGFNLRRLTSKVAIEMTSCVGIKLVFFTRQGHQGTASLHYRLYSLKMVRVAMGAYHQTDIFYLKAIFLHSQGQGIKAILPQFVPDMSRVNQYMRSPSPQSMAQKASIAIIPPAHPYIAVKVLSYLY